MLPDISKLNKLELEELQKQIELRMQVLSINSVPEPFMLESVGHKYVGSKAYCAIVDQNKKVFQWLNPDETDYSGAYTTKKYLIGINMVGNQLMWGDTSSRKAYRKYGKVSIKDDKVVVI